MSHVVLLGDSIFDNARYVPGGPSVIEQLDKALPRGWRATLLAFDGSVAEDVVPQLKRVPDDATHLVVSTGGNNALAYRNLILYERADSFADALDRLARIRLEFQREYREMLSRVRSLEKPTVVCTIYDSIPGLEPELHTGLCIFNDVILREAACAGVPVIDLRPICSEASDYSNISPIEPSVSGGSKIVQAVSRVVINHDFSAGVCSVYA